MNIFLYPWHFVPFFWWCSETKGEHVWCIDWSGQILRRKYFLMHDGEGMGFPTLRKKQIILIPQQNFVHTRFVPIKSATSVETVLTHKSWGWSHLEVEVWRQSRPPLLSLFSSHGRVGGRGGARGGEEPGVGERGGGTARLEKYINGLCTTETIEWYESKLTALLQKETGWGIELLLALFTQTQQRAFRSRTAEGNYTIYRVYISYLAVIFQEIFTLQYIFG